MQKILIVGATSAIAEQTCRIYAARGDSLFLVARNPNRLEAIRQDLQLRGAHYADTATLDINDIQRHDRVLQLAWQALGEIDVVLIATGTLPDQLACQDLVAKTLDEFGTNATAIIALLTPLANRLQMQGRGTLAVISSVAGDRGRQSNYVYGAAKAAVTTFLGGLRQRLVKHGVNVVTIKPGFVDTPMTREFKKGPLWTKPETVARGIVRSIDRRCGTVYLPWFWSFIMLIIRHIPESIFKRIKL